MCFDWWMRESIHHLIKGLLISHMSMMINIKKPGNNFFPFGLKWCVAETQGRVMGKAGHTNCLPGFQ